MIWRGLILVLKHVTLSIGLGGWGSFCICYAHALCRTVKVSKLFLNCNTEQKVIELKMFAVE